MKRFIASSVASCVLLAAAGCGGRGETASSASILPVVPSVRIVPAEVPASYRCLPAIGAAGGRENPELAYVQNCAVSGATEGVRLQELAVALVGTSSAGGTYHEYCTAIPLAYDSINNVGFAATAAHCVIGGSKAAGAHITPRNIETFSGRAELYQTTPARDLTADKLTAQVLAVYVPTQYCKALAISRHCAKPSEQNGDVAILKVGGLNGRQLHVNPHMQLAPASFSLAADSEILALGYGKNTTPTPDDRVLYYLTYRYFATNAYGGTSGLLAIMNGWRQNGLYYAVLCQGDSGGGDFAWDGAKWNLVGIHSYGNVPCGKSSPSYSSAIAASADTRPWEAWMHEILSKDTSPAGCANLDSARFTCRSR